MPVAQGAQEPGLGAVLRDLGLEIGAGLAPLGQFRIGRLAQELIRQPDLEEDAVVHRHDELVGRPPGLLDQIGEPIVAPGDDRVVGRQLLQLPIKAEILRESPIDALNVRLAVSPLLSSDRQPRVHLRDEGPVRAHVGEDVRLGDRALRLHRQVRAPGRAQAHDGGRDAQHLAGPETHMSVPPGMIFGHWVRTGE